jgi:hypothetical protein
MDAHLPMEICMSYLEAAIRLAVEAHAGQRDKAGKPYILHPLRVMQGCETEILQTIAVLHDVIEDTALTLDALTTMGFPSEVTNALACLTKQPGENYDDFIGRVLTDPLATRVKELDLLDNMDCTRLAGFNDADAARMAKYTAALGRIRAARPAGQVRLGSGT